MYRLHRNLLVVPAVLLNAAACASDTSGPTSGQTGPTEGQRLVIVQGQNLTALMLDTVLVVVESLDGSGRPEAGTAVFAEVTAGGGFRAPGPTSTGSDGRVSLRWVLGPTAGSQEMIVRRTNPAAEVRVTGNATGQLDLWRFGRVSAGYQTTCAVANDGSAYCWGEARNGQLGSGPVEPQASPRRIPGSQSWMDVGSGMSYACGLTIDKALFCWGTGPATGMANVTSPTLVAGGPWRQISIGVSHVCAISEDKRAYCWGEDLAGRLGQSTAGNRTVPSEVVGAIQWSSIAAGGQHTCGIAVSGGGYCWGVGLLVGSEVGNTATPRPIAGGYAWSKISAGGTHTCGLTTQAEAFCWGQGVGGRLGYGAEPSQLTPVKVVGGFKWKDIAAGQAASCGVTADNKLYCWGTLGTVKSQPSPTSVRPDMTWSSVSVGSSQGEVTEGGHACAVTTDGRTFCWGLNDLGQLGIGAKLSVGDPALLYRGVIRP
jgi:alpha-tubulin suppressor-like RCC1 family protein